ncbi:uncharacterized protein LOC128682758 [Plodia interpunctella]|uniref:uncharacterized protein LOC128682758 n=1 Tax=Plodia interpunctella TaxID=58824 RepID=UPI002368AF7B|nr:uncharacterized protein LOC128681567 [Plodia interpunctella]XP_053623554.1 uncharacterized protein LOC128682758 [Plodia interpunctella]
MSTSTDKSDASNSNNSQLKDLITIRGTKKGALTKFKTYVTPLHTIPVDTLSSLQIKELKIRLSKIEHLFGEFDEIQTKIELLTDNATHHQERDLFEAQYYHTLAVAQDILESHTKLCDDKISDCSQPSAPTVACGKLNNIKLPTIALPKFDGNYIKWLEFKDTFDSLINSNDSISSINKFHYLRACLEGNAAVVIKSLEFTSNNYQVAWDLLCQRFDNKKILINNHLKAIFNIESLTRESHKSLRFIIDHMSKNLRALDSLGLPTNQWDVLIIYIMSTKIDPITLRKWEESRNNACSDLPTLSDFIQFLRNQADILETMFVNKSDKPSTFHKDKKSENDKRDSFQFKEKNLLTSNKSSTSATCAFCNKAHRLIECSDFNTLSPEGRLSEALKLKLCLNCLRKGHTVNDCRLTGTCRICKQKHNTLIHTNSSPVTLSAQSSNQVLLGTVILNVTNPKTKTSYRARAILDAGSQSSFLTLNLKHKLGLTCQNVSANITGINNEPLCISEICKLTINSLVSPFNASLSCLVMPQITGHLPNALVDPSLLNLPKNICLADPKFYQPSEVDMLLGAEIFFDIISPNQIKLGPGLPVLQDSKLGWFIAGPLNYNLNLNISHNSNKKIHCNFTKEISDKLSQFWNLEEVQLSKPPMSANDEYCEQHFLNTTKRLENGRFSVMIPFSENPEAALGNSFNIAKRQFLNLEKRLNKNPNLKEQYINFIEEYKDLGHLTKIKTPHFGYFMPHHPVIRDSSETTRLRVVFNASMKTSSNRSLNDIQLVGPVVQDDLFNILIRFRQHQYVLSGDITKHYRQINIDESQRHLQLILWRNDEDSSEDLKSPRPLDTLQLNTVTYGTASAPFLSTRCLIQLANECPDQMVSEVIKKDFYVDDLLTGASNELDLKHIYENVTKTLASACFPIRKFRTNCPQIFSEQTETQSLDFSKESSVLGVLWAPNTDTLRFSINLDFEKTTITKRLMLSNTCKIFDPLGLLSACTITLKILLQDIWQLKLEWDDPVPSNIIKKWESLTRQLNSLLSLSIPRFALCSLPVSTEIHCFVDASQSAYAACVYLRSTDANNVITIHLLSSKTRVAPLKSVTIPRLELCAALLGSRLVSKICNALRCKIKTKIYWSDSTITLGWIRTQPKLLKAFVCNRINEIHDLTERDSWRYVPTDLNPADMASRGVEPTVLVNSSFWWHGPTFLLKHNSEWPQFPNTIVNLPELKVHLVQDENDSSIDLIKFENYSNASKLKRIFAYVFRFINNCIKIKQKLYGPLEEHELKTSLNYLIKTSQSQSFPSEIKLLSQGKSLNPKSHILQLTPFIDPTGVLRVGGRLENTSLNYDKRHPALLDSKHHFTKILMSDEHQRLFHAGPQQLLSSFREQFWPIGGRILSRSTVRKCIICTRLKGKTMEPLLGNLPACRVSRFYPFQTCGADFAGPFLISSKKGRGNKISKCYLCLFICFSTKAVHLEVVSELSTQAFILRLKRFIARRSKPHVIHCDNGKNFVGANNELGRVLRTSLRSIKEYTANEGIKFSHIAPYSPTLGGLWESNVKSSKYLLKRIVGNSTFTFEELSTLFTQIESILNSRPLIPLSSDPSDLSPLTPGHFLVGRPLTSLPEPPCENIKGGHHNRYKLIETCRQQFWNRWSKEYLAEMQQRNKNKIRNRELKVGDMVVFKEPLPPLKWRMGRVCRLYPGTDKVCRVADFITQRGIERRALNRVCLLPTDGWDCLKEASSSFKGGQDAKAPSL